MEIMMRFKSWVVWIGTLSVFVLGWFSSKSDDEIPEPILKHKKMILFILGFLTIFATLNNPTNPSGF